MNTAFFNAAIERNYQSYIGTRKSDPHPPAYATPCHSAASCSLPVLPNERSS